MNSQDTIFNVLHTFFINILLCYVYVKALNYKPHKHSLILIVFVTFLVSVTHSIIKSHINHNFMDIITCITTCFLMGFIAKNKIGHSLLVTVFSWCIFQIAFFISTIISYLPYLLLGIENDFVNLFILIFISSLSLHFFFKIKRVNHGFAFLQNRRRNEYIDIFVLNICIIIIFLYYLGFILDKSIAIQAFTSFSAVFAILIVVIQKTFLLYQKHKLLEDTIHIYENEITEKDTEIEKLHKENLKSLETNHAFKHRQESLALKIDKLLLNSEISDELGIHGEIEELTSKYFSEIGKASSLPPLAKTEISEIDDMLSLMQFKCHESNIEFALNLNGNIHYMVNHFIPKEKLELLIADHIKDAIIAINSGKAQKNIMVMLGLFGDSYKLCIHDSGIPFEIDTLLNLGLSPITTHANSGGTGIGFMTTFKTIKECNASLIIEEKDPENLTYTKSVTISFDNKNEYRIRSYRAKEIIEKQKDNRIIVDFI